MKKKLAVVLSAIMAIGVLGSVSFSSATTLNAAEGQEQEFKNPVYNESTDTTDYDYAYFGMYPTSEVTGSALTDEIKNAEYEDNVVAEAELAEVDGVKYLRMLQSNSSSYNVRNTKLKGLYTDEAFYKWKDNKTYHY